MTPLMVACRHCRGDETLALEVVELLLNPPPIAAVLLPPPPPADWRLTLPATSDLGRLPTVRVGVQLQAGDGGDDGGGVGGSSSCAGVLLQVEEEGDGANGAKQQEQQEEMAESTSGLVFGDGDTPGPDPASSSSCRGRGADPNKSAAGGLCPLHIAALEGRSRVISALLGAKADVNARLEATGESAYNLARLVGGHADVVAVLEAAGCDTTPVLWQEPEPEPEPEREREPEPEPEQELK
jgi:hypothetical protein